MRISDWSSDVCSSDLVCAVSLLLLFEYRQIALHYRRRDASLARQDISPRDLVRVFRVAELDRETGFPLLLEISIQRIIIASWLALPTKIAVEKVSHQKPALPLCCR